MDVGFDIPKQLKAEEANSLKRTTTVQQASKNAA
jgi:hypothetical protein